MITRDGAYVSLWQEMPVYQTQNKPTFTELYDVIIVGGGITGISVGLLLQKSGLKCLILESHNIGFGTTSGTTAHLNTLLDTPYTTIQKNFGRENARLVATAAREAIHLIRYHIEDYRIDCGFEEAAAYLFSQDEKQSRELEDIAIASEEAGLALSYTSSIPVAIPFEKAIRVEGQAKFHPLKYVYALANQYEAAGGTILQYSRVTNTNEDDEIIDVESEAATFKTKRLIYATHIPPTVNLLHLRCSPWRSYAMAVRLEDDHYPEGLCYDMHDPYHYYRTQIIDGTKYLIAGGEDHKTGHEPNTEKCFRQLESHIRQYFKIREVAYQWSSQYFEPADGLPYIGHLPGHSENVYVATGYGGNGMIYSSVAAIVLRDLIVQKESIFADLFSPSRVKPVAGFANFIEHNADVAKQFIGKWFATETLDEMASLAPGEGKVVKYNGEIIAVSKDSDGTLHAVSPTCTHLKCSVAWNLAEQTWDCPCHGARYDAEGNVLTGPASRNLEVIELRTLSRV
ncbi:MAG TPA: FAD-dependent oxidoreductase [Ohtaekwangia sp.]|uniref:FAD-dependent oxidoreductase n=1 Tax=Ohtaekwangia sp. TaxID=2066019 RepID=UPI002F91EB53